MRAFDFSHLWHRVRGALWVFSIISVVALPGSLVFAEQGDDVALMQHRSKHSFHSVLGFPPVAARPVQTREWLVSLEQSNQFMGGTTDDERLVIDGEMTEIRLQHRQRVGPCWQLEAIIPFYQHHEGLFDRAIDDWHKFFGLPDASRDETAFFQLNHIYESDGERRIAVTRPQSGIGDIQLSLQKSLGCFATSDATAAEAIARVGIKLPTGDIDELSGSDRADLFVDIQSPVYKPAERWTFGATVGALLVGRQAKLPNQQSLVAYGSIGVQYRLHQRWRVLSQIDWHSAAFQSQLRELGQFSVSLSAGLRFLADKDQTIEFTFSEDAAIDTAPDIVARLAWIVRPGGGF